jgi:4,5-DOPA dioxygenase extradiol
MNVLFKSPYSSSLSELAVNIPVPEAILVVSAHYNTSSLRITSSQSPRQMFDFVGFPEELYKVDYHSPGEPAVAERAAALLGEAGLPCALDPNRGLDHAAWAILLHMYPEPKIPVVELSLDYHMKPSRWYDVGAALSPLRDEGVLVMGSGNIVHNLFEFENEMNVDPYPWAKTFVDLVKAKVAANDLDSLVKYAYPVEESKLSIPTPEHYLPFLAILGSRTEGETVRYFHDSFQNASISMLSFTVSS